MKFFTIPEVVQRHVNFKSILEWLFFLCPVSLAINKNADDYVAALLFAVSCLFLLSRLKTSLSAIRSARPLWVLALTMPLLLVTVQGVALQPPLAFRDFDDYSRFFFCIPIYFAAISLRLDTRKFLWGCLFFTLYSVPLMIYQMLVVNAGRAPPPNGFLGIIPHTSFAIILSLASLQLATTGRGFIRTRLLPGIALLSALVMPLLTQTRSGFLLLIALGLLVWLLQPQRQLKILAGIGAATLAIIVLITTSHHFWGRSDNALAEIRNYATATAPTQLTSATTRIELWRAAGIMALTHPLIGVGNHHFRDVLGEMKAHRLTPEALEIYSHPHNDFLKMASEGGLLGVFAFVLLLGVPLVYGGRAYQRTRGIGDPAWMVIVLASGVLIAGIVDVVFIWRPTIMFYGMSMSLLLASLDNGSRQEPA